MERLLEVISFEATDRSGDEVVVDKAYVDKNLGKLIADEDLGVTSYRLFTLRRLKERF